MRWLRALLGVVVLVSTVVASPLSAAVADPGSLDAVVALVNGSTYVYDATRPERRVTASTQVTPGDTIFTVTGWSTGTVYRVDLHHSESLLVGRQSSKPVLGQSGTLDVSQLERDAAGGIVALAVSWILDPTDPGPPGPPQPLSGLLRWHSSVPWRAVGVSVPRFQVVTEIGVPARLDVEVTNVGPDSLPQLPMTVTGAHASAWGVDPSSDCTAVLPLASMSSCTLTLVLSPDGASYSTPAVEVAWDDWRQVVVPELQVLVVGPPAPPVLAASRSALGGGVRWQHDREQQAEVSRSDDGGVTWGAPVVVLPDGTSGDHRWTDPSGFTARDDVRYRVRVTDQPAYDAQQHLYTSDWAEIAAPAPREAGLAYLVGGRLSSGVPGSTAVATLPLPVSAWAASSDGSELVVAGSIPPLGTRAVARVDLTDGHAGAPATLYPTSGPVTALAWSPDGRTLAWTQQDDPTSLRTAPASGSGPVLVAPIPPLSTLRGWLPDSQVVVVGHTFYDTVSRQTVDAGVTGDLVVSPDGRRALAVTPQAGSTASVVEYALEPNTLRLTATGRSASTTTMGEIGQHVPTVIGYAPDGRSLLVRGVVGELARVPLDTGALLAPAVALAEGLGVYRAAWLSTAPRLQARLTGTAVVGFTVSPGLMAPGTVVTCRLDAGATVACPTAWTAPAGLSGRHTLTVVGTEPGGRSATAARTWANGPALLYPGTTGTMPGLYAALPSPRRVLDTRSGVGAPRARVGAAGSLTLTIPGLPADATAVSLNLTAVNATVPTYVAAYPADAARPVGSSLNVSGPRPIANLVTVRVAPGGRVVLYNANGATDLVADLQGYYARSGSSRFTPITPLRVVDSRTGTGITRGPVFQMDATSLVGSLVEGSAPAVISALALNATVTAPSTAGYLSLGDFDGGRPATSNLNYVAQQTVANLALVPTPRSSGSSVGVWLGGGPAQVIGDLLGYFGSTGSAFTPTTPTRVLDTRSGLGAVRARVGAGGSVTVTIPRLPAGTRAVAVNVTAVAPSTAGYVTAYPAGQPRPATSTLNFAAGQTVANSTLVGVDAQGRVTLTNTAGPTDLLLDLQGWFAG